MCGVEVKVCYPTSWKPEAEFLSQVVFRERFGLKVSLEESPNGQWKLSPLGGGKSVYLDSTDKPWSPDCAFNVDLLPINSLDFGSDENDQGGVSIPTIRGRGRSADGDDYRVESLFLSSIFLILSGHFESEGAGLDEHDRHTASNIEWVAESDSMTPVVDVYLKLLADCLAEAIPGFSYQIPESVISPSHDVDHPFVYRAMGVSGVLRRSAADVVKRRKPWNVPSTLWNWGKCRMGRPSGDPFYSFDWIMNQSESRGLTSTFYFITDHSHPTMDGTYSFDDPCIHRLLNEIHDRGHQIGLHASYNTYLDGEQIQREFDILRTTCDQLGIKQKEWGSRQHYLRWRTPETARHLNAAGVDFDASLGLASTGGFRNGTCHEFPLFDLEARKTLELKERPLVVMECSIIDSRYRGLGTGADALMAMTGLKNTCKKHGGDFQILWHNDRFERPSERSLYEAILDA